MDLFGNIWLTGVNLGLMVARPDGSVHRLAPSPFSAGQANPICDREGSVWIASSRGLFQFTPTRFVTWQIDRDDSERRVFSITEDGEGRMWFGNRRELLHLGRGGRHLVSSESSQSGGWVPFGLPLGGVLGESGSKLIFSKPESAKQIGDCGPMLGRTRDGSVWASAKGGQGMLRIRQVEGGHEIETVQFDMPEGAELRSLGDDSSGRLYVTIYPAGLFEYQVPGGFRSLSPADGAEAKRISFLHVDPDDNVWVTARGPDGIGFWSSRDQEWFFAEFSEVGATMEMPAFNVGIMADRDGGFWLTTTAGLYRAEREELEAAVRAGSGEVEWKSFDRSDGLRTTACSFHPTGIYLASDDKVWVATDSGISVTDPAAQRLVREKMPAPEVRITSVAVR